MFNKLYSKIKENILFVISILIILIFIILFKIELPYTIYMSGGTSNVSTSIKVENESISTGTYKSLYVLSTKANPITYLLSKVISKWDLIENKEMILNEDEKYDDIFLRDKLFLEYSKMLAIKTAYTKANKEYKILETNLYVIGSECDIKIGEKILKIDDIIVNDVSDIKKILENKNINDEVIVESIYKDNTYKRSIKIREKDGNKILGIYAIKLEKYEVNPKIEIKTDSNEAGASSGLMLTLSIYDKLIDEDLSKGLLIAGTGRIE